MYKIVRKKNFITQISPFLQTNAVTSTTILVWKFYKITCEIEIFYYDLYGSVERNYKFYWNCWKGIGIYIQVKWNILHKEV